MTVVGTAGHVDHGKSTLLEAMTGRDPDRWAEEKRRGLTIDLGFVWMTMPSGREVSFVDVPGHERFIKNMLAGIESIDVALFVVAADEGWMPQSEEHLAVLDLLGVDRAVVALTKVDRVDADLVELATLETLERLEGTTLEGSPIVPVSAPASEGLDRLVTALDAALPDLEAGDDPHLWIDRRFSVAGAGTIVTGTLLGGPVTVGDSLVTHPEGASVRVRGLESHEQTLETLAPHRRAAVNVVGFPDHLGRGTMLGGEDRWLPSDVFTARLRTARYVEEFGEKGAFHVHMGTAAVPARLRPVGDGYLVRLDRPLPLRYGEPLIIRETGRRAVVAGGVVLDPAPAGKGRQIRASARIPADLAPPDAAAELLAIRGQEHLSRLVAHAGEQPSDVTVVGGLAVTDPELDRLRSRAATEVEAFHSSNPLREGLPLATLASRLGTTGDLAAHAVSSSPELETDGAVVWRSGHTVTLDPAQEEAWASARSMLEQGGLQAPRMSELPVGIEVVHRLIRAGELVRISDELVYLPAEAERLRREIAGMGEGFTVAEFRDHLQISRKYAVPILEWADSEGLTRRIGDTRFPVASAEAPKAGDDSASG